MTPVTPVRAFAPVLIALLFGCQLSDPLDEAYLDQYVTADADREYPCSLDKGEARGTHPKCTTKITGDGKAVKECKGILVNDKCIIEEIEVTESGLEFVHKECDKRCDKCDEGDFEDKSTKACGNCHIKGPHGDDCVVNGRCVSKQTKSCETPMTECHSDVITLEPAVQTPDGKSWEACIPNSAFCEDAESGCPEES